MERWKDMILILVKQVSEAVRIPVIAAGGARDIYDFKEVLNEGGAHAAAASSMFIYYGKQKTVLITVPSEDELVEIGIYRE
jgi:cyclase